MVRKKRLIRKERKTWYQRLTSWTLRLLVVLVVLAGIAVGMLSLLAGTGDMQRRGLQQAMTRMTGMKAEIGQLAALKIVPKIVVEVRDVTFRPFRPAQNGTSREAAKGEDDRRNANKTPRDAAEAQPESNQDIGSIAQQVPTGPVQARLGRARIELSILQLFIGNGVFSEFTIEDLQAEAGLLGGGELALKRGTIRPASERDNAQSPAWMFKGHYAGKPLSGTIGLKQHSAGGAENPASYYLGANIPLALAIGDYKLQGQFDSEENGSSLRDLVLKHNERNVAEGRINRQFFKKAERYKAELDFGRSRVTGEITGKRTGAQDSQHFRFDGTITFAELHLEDLGDKPASLAGFAGFIGETFAKAPENAGPQPIDLGDTPFSLDITIARLMTDKRTIGHMKLPVALSDDTLRIAPISGELADGRIAGNFVLNAGKSPAELKIKTHISDSNYTALQTAAGGSASVKGRANLDIDLISRGKTWPALKRNLNGHISILAGRGELASSALDIWGGGLTNAMIPDFGEKSTNVLNCAVAHFELEKSVATAAPLFLDTKQVTISGAGTINLRKKNALNLVLTPNAKQTAPFDVATAVNVSGSLHDPYIAPNMASSAGKVGGLLLGTVNPAFLAFSMTDFGLTEQAPCKPFLLDDGSGRARQTMPALEAGAPEARPSAQQDASEAPSAQHSETPAQIRKPRQQTGQTPN